MVRAAFFLFSFFFVFANATHAQGKIVANIYGLKNNEGICLACLFNNNTAFKGEGGQAMKCVAGNIQNYSSQIIFSNIPQGEYAIKFFHDENNNRQIDKNFLGIPKEGYGASMNKLRFAAAPTYDDNSFVLEDDSVITLSIKLRYL